MAQLVSVQAENKPLNEVLVDLRDSYNVQFSFSDNLLKDCRVTDSTTYESMDQAVSTLVSRCKFVYKLVRKQYVIYLPKTIEVEQKKASKLFHMQLKVVDRESGESLPFVAALFNESGLNGDVNGQFTYATSEPGVRAKLSYVGYFPLDTTLKSNIGSHTLSLVPRIIELEEVAIKSADPETEVAPVGTQAGLLKLNYRLAKFLPGSSENVIFNMLRLQPGILAAGEQTNDFIIWGSYKGQSKVVFDGITLFSVSSTNDNIGAVNPLLVKDIEVLKGGYNVQYGDRVGGMVNISGKDGNKDKVAGNLRLTNETVNGILSMPVWKNGALQLAFRKTYAHRYSNPIVAKRDNLPEQNFGDVNLKLSKSWDNGDALSLHVLTSKELYSHKLSAMKGPREYGSETENNRQQLGGAISYAKQWNRAGRTNFTLASSSLRSSTLNMWNFKGPLSIDSSGAGKVITENGISELSMVMDHNFPTTDHHSVSVGVGQVQNASGFSQDSLRDNLKNAADGAKRFHAYIKDRISLGTKWSVEPGLRTVRDLASGKSYLQPRINITATPANRWRVNLAVGSYNQFITEDALVDEYGNAIYYWNVNGAKIAGVVTGVHMVTGLSYSYKTFNFSVEGFYKTLNNLTRYFFDYRTQQILYTADGDGISRGIDAYLRRKFGRHNFWVSYTLSKSEERFSHFPGNRWQRAPQDQRHEIKTAGLINLKPFFISANYVLGSGIPSSNNFQARTSVAQYSRFDLALMYQLHKPNTKWEFGASVLNVFNTRNLRFNNFFGFPDKSVAFTPATPFTPTVFLNLSF